MVSPSKFAQGVGSLICSRELPGLNLCQDIDYGGCRKGKVAPVINQLSTMACRLTGGAEVLDGDKWSSSRPGRFNLGERAPGTHWIGGCVRLRAGLDALEQRKIPCPCR
jgi:hypothetical protein